MISPAISLFWVRALNCLQNSMMLICAWPSAGPTGGAGVALPASICNLTDVCTFFGAICSLFFENLYRLCGTGTPACALLISCEPQAPRLRIHLSPRRASQLKGFPLYARDKTKLTLPLSLLAQTPVLPALPGQRS